MTHFYFTQKLETTFKSMSYLPSPSSLSYFWNLGSLLGICLTLQLVTGIFLAIHYVSDVAQAFDLISHIMRDVNQGWLLRIAHANGASAFFLCLYLHISRGIFYSSFLLSSTWLIGCVLFVLVMAIAFLGYVLPWGQMSFWGATVITNLFSAIPFLGSDIVLWLWGGFSVTQATLNRFFVFHFLFPFILTGLVLAHLVLLHESGSSNPLGLPLNSDKVAFHPLYTTKDLLGVFILAGAFVFLILAHPWSLGDPENFNAANPLVTPLHIQPEWYFLFAYAILRSIPNKAGGVLGLAASVMVIFLLPMIRRPLISSKKFCPPAMIAFWSLIVVFFLLTWLGACPVEPPFYALGQMISCLYFFLYLLESVLSQSWESVCLNS